MTERGTTHKYITMLSAYIHVYTCVYVCTVIILLYWYIRVTHALVSRYRDYQARTTDAEMAAVRNRLGVSVYAL